MGVSKGWFDYQVSNFLGWKSRTPATFYGGGVVSEEPPYLGNNISVSNLVLTFLSTDDLGLACRDDSGI